MKNLFATVLTHPAPTANYRGENEETRAIIQKISRGDQDYAVISPDSMRNALREILAAYGLPCNRRRLHEEGQLAVEYKGYPDATKYADDFLFGFMVADNKAINKNKGVPSKRDSVLRMNLAVALVPYADNAIFHQSPMITGGGGWQNSSTSALLHREVSDTAFQFPFALAGNDVMKGGGAEWTRALLRAIGELSNVAGGHARSYYEMAPKSLVARLTSSLVAGYSTYGFNAKEEFPDLARINANDLPGREFWVAGELSRSMPAPEKARLVAEGVKFFDNPQRAIEDLGKGLTVEGK